jgi:uncharacterized DUF497 family protein
MTYEWDEKKNKTNEKKHGLNFADAEYVFGGQVLTVEDVGEDYGEQRFNCLGLLEDRVVHITYTERGDITHIISMRKANKREQKIYFERVRGKKID